MSHSFPGSDDISRVELPNGITVLTRENFHSPSVVINGYLHTGSLYEPTGKLGLANFTVAALMRGTQRHAFQEIFDALESIGASLRISGGTHTTAFGGQALAEDAEVVIDLLAEVLRTPVFPEVQVERLRSQILTGLAIRAHETEAMAQLTFDQLVYTGHPYGLPEEGFPETVLEIQKQDLIDFHQKNFGPRGMVIAIVGAINPDQAINLVNQHLGDWMNPEQPTPPALPPVIPLQELTVRQVVIPGKSQADLILGAAGPPRSAPDFVPANLGNSILGQFGLMGRIGEAVREKAGLAYYAQSNLSGGLGPGPWDVSAGVDPNNVERTINLIQAEIRHFIRELVSVEELEDVQAQFIGSLPLSLESNFGVASALVNLERHQLGLDYYRNYTAMIKAVTREDVLSAACHYLDPDRLGVAVAGPEVDGGGYEPDHGG